MLFIFSPYSLTQLSFSFNGDSQVSGFTGHRSSTDTGTGEIKVFTPINDSMLSSISSRKDEVGRGRLVPFHPDFLRGERVPVREGVKPSNWIAESDYASACRRLRESAAV